MVTKFFLKKILSLHSNLKTHIMKYTSDTAFTQNRVSIVEKYGEEKAEKIIKFFDDFFKDLKETTFENYKDNVFFYTIDNTGTPKIWMEQDSKNGRLWCRWSGFWSFFENEMKLDYFETQSLVKTMVEQHLSRPVGTPVVSATHTFGWNSN
jgi:uncharacterized protein YqkB